MLIRSLHLKNIRSYTDEVFEFREGTSLLAGDIGSGKTTILLAIEFAVFGIVKGVVSGYTLLRHGSNQGSVELNFTIDNKSVCIRRSLKRSNIGILQDSGILTINNEVFEGTPQELKSRILNLLGYPESLLNKSKSLIFRYTVFTPQEEMKKIIYENPDERLDILRRLFNIDKYKRIKDNSLAYIKDLRSNINFLEGKLESLPDKLNELKQYDESILVFKENLKTKDAELKEFSFILDSKLVSVSKSESDLEELRELSKRLEIASSELKSSERILERNRMEQSRLRDEVQSILNSLAGFDFSKVDEIKSKVENKKAELKKIESNISEILSKTADNSAKKNNAESILNKISHLDKCPTCLQEVKPEHVETVKARESQIIHGAKTNIEKLKLFEAQFKARKEAVQAELDNYAKGEQEFTLKKFKFESLEGKKKQLSHLEEEQSNLIKSIESKKTSITTTANILAKLGPTKEKLEKDKLELDQLRRKYSKMEQLYSEEKAKIDMTNKILLQLKSEIDKLKLEESKLNKLKGNKSWLEDDFLNAVDLMEKSVLSKIHDEFNSFFQDWFNILIDDESISVKLDSSFTPIIEQNGYETEIDNLSGGEKTSVALAYRLSLNKVINDFMTSVKTRDLIILDEPTEGFSSDQLDRVREVLNQTKVLQTLIVSHESKMEGFVDQVIRIRKQGHESQKL